MTGAELKEKENENGLTAENAMETFLLNKSTHKNYTVNFQDVNKTNALLRKNGITPDSLWKYDKSLSRRLRSYANTIIYAIMKKAAKKFPYNK